jgi:hypothetical protein
MTYDLESGPSVTVGPDWVAHAIVVEAHSERGEMFLNAYSEATDRKFDCDIWEAEDGSWGVESLHFVSEEEFERFKQQASLAGVTLLKSHKPEPASCDGERGSPVQ